MTRRLGWRARIAVAVLCSGVAIDAVAQPANRSVVRFTSDVFGGWDRALSSSDLAVAPGRREVTYGGLNAALSYAKTFRNVSFTSAATASTRYSPRFAESFVPFYGLSMALTSAGTRRWSWSLTQDVGYGRRNATGLFAAGGLDARSLAFGLPSSPVDYLLSDDDLFTSMTTASLGFGFSRRDRMTIGATASTFVNTNLDAQRFARVGGFVNYARRIGRYGGIVAGYNHSENVALGGAREAEARIATANLGVSYARTLPFARETTLALNSGITGTPRGDGWFYTAVGRASLARPLGRDWVGQIGVSRALQYVPVFVEPTLVNAVSASIGGNLSRRLTATFGGNFSTGRAGFVDTRTDFDAYSGSAQLRYAVFRQAGLFTEYFYFLASSRSQGPSELPAGEFARHGVRFGLSFGTELLGGRR
jgi:hypothetical protein